MGSKINIVISGLVWIVFQTSPFLQKYFFSNFFSHESIYIIETKEKGMIRMREQLTQFLLDNQQKFYRYAFTYVHHRELAMDMVQNSFVKAIEQIHTLRNPAAMKTWFYRILTNECLQALKKAKREDLVEPADIQDEIYLEKAFEPSLELYEAVRKLSPETQTIIYLHYYEEYTLKEISKITGDNLNTVKSRLYAGLKKLKTIVKEDVQ